VRKICPECIESYEPPESIYKTIDEQLKTIKGEFAKPFRPQLLYHGKGCASCNFTGYRGRLAIYESFDVNEEVRAYIQKPNFSLDGLKKIAFVRGSKTMFEDGLQKSEIGLTTIEEVMRVIKE